MQDKRSNCINLIRLIAALQVFVGHAIPAFSLKADAWWIDIPLRFLFIFEGVPIFFCLSGFLIWDSIERTADFKGFISKRVFRLYPELWGGVLLNMLLVAVLYFEHIEWFSFGLFQVAQATILQFWTPESLAGYATGTPNGPLWTICVMVQAYVALWFFHKILHKKGLSRWIVTLVLTTLINVLRPLCSALLPAFLYKLSFYVFASHIWLFLVGAFVSEYFEAIIVWLKKFWWLGLIISQAAVITGFDYGTYKTIKSLFLGLAVIGIGYAFPKWTIKHDFSYGLYIYHMIVINVMVFFGCESNLAWMLLSLVISMVLAIVSYFTVGKISRLLRKKAV